MSEEIKKDAIPVEIKKDDVRAKAKKKEGMMTAIITRTSRWFGFATDVDVTFDTAGYYSHPRGAPATSEWAMEDRGYGISSRFIAQKREYAKEETLRGWLGGITFHVEPLRIKGYYDSNKGFKKPSDPFIIWRDSDTKHWIMYPSKDMHIDDAMFIVDFIIRHL